MNSNSQESNDTELIAAIEEYLENDENSGIDPRIFAILDSITFSRWH